MKRSLNFGCGDKILEGFVNVDVQEGEGIDLSFDFDKFPYDKLEDNHYEEIIIDNVLEHLDSPDKTLKELLKKGTHGGIVKIIVPHYSNKGAYNDLQHKRFFNEQAFINFANCTNKITKKELFEIGDITLTPTLIGKWLPKFLREKLSLFIGGLISQIEITYYIKK